LRRKIKAKIKKKKKTQLALTFDDEAAGWVGGEGGREGKNQKYTDIFQYQ
jgi:hypothetical protein